MKEFFHSVKCSFVRWLCLSFVAVRRVGMEVLDREIFRALMGKAIAFGIDGRSLTLGQRIEQCIASAGGLNAAAEAVGMTPQGLRRLVREESLRGPPLLSMLQLAQRAGVTLDWLATGYDRRPDMAPIGKEFAVLFRYSAAPDGATVEITDHGGDIAFRGEWLRATLGISEGDAGLLTMRGDAMVPTIREGATLIIDRGAKVVREAGIYALLLANEVAVRRAQPLRDGGVKLSADNPLYEPEMVPAREVVKLRLAGRVRAALMSV